MTGQRLLKSLPCTLAMVLGAVAFSGVAAAQTAPKLVVKTGATSEISIDLDTATPVVVNPNGDIEAACKLNTAGDACVTPIGSGTGGGPTNLGLALTTKVGTAVATALTTDQQLTVEWSAASAKACLATGAVPAVSAWTSTTPVAKSGSKTFTLGVGTYTFNMTCYAETGHESKTTANVVVTQGAGGGGTGGTATCDEVYPTKPTSVFFNARGYTKIQQTFQQVFGHSFDVVTPGTQLVKVPGTPIGADMRSKYLTIPFSLPANDTVIVNWYELQTGGIPASGAISLSISPCPGDFRKKRGSNATSDSFLYASCRSESRSGSMTFTTNTSGIGCKLQANKTYYLNMAGYQFHTTDSTAENAEFTPLFACSSGITTCDVKIKSE